MPYAAPGKVSMAEMAGAVAITATQYADALAAMTDPVTPRQVSVVGGVFSMVPVSLPATQTLPLASATTLPNVDGSSRAPVCTGLARHPSGLGWLVGDDGRTGRGDTSFDAGVIWYDEAWAQVARYRRADLGYGDNKFSVQGVAGDPRDGSFYFIAKDTDGSDTAILQVSATGTPVRAIPVHTNSNGLMIIPEQNQLVVLIDEKRLVRRDLATGAVIAQTPIDLKSQDHLHYLGDGKALVTHGANGVNGAAVLIDVSTQNVEQDRRIVLSGADAVEGVVYHNGRLYVTNDAKFHPGSPALNRVLVYDAQGLF